MFQFVLSTGLLEYYNGPTNARHSAKPDTDRCQPNERLYYGGFYATSRHNAATRSGDNGRKRHQTIMNIETGFINIYKVYFKEASNILENREPSIIIAPNDCCF